ncbi:hypothetical protein CIW83_09520 [Tissierella sp. P1]|uniref:hypothetical protein n=1 Tax=Tissierella sp. P1 TaxID=1280483 RepID=UPI000BA107A8|nr:hypothetical protein [Tissierella sp. P1]OZV12325.1 hypothetical protein CIW83_09520 [Tissierella sp. P1]
MPPDKLDIGKIFIKDLNTGEEMELNEIADINITTDRIEEIEPIRTPREISFSMDVSQVSIEAIEQLMPKVRILGLLYSQNKTHRKHRINKKWAKRYGYTCTVYYA